MAGSGRFTSDIDYMHINKTFFISYVFLKIDFHGDMNRLSYLYNNNNNDNNNFYFILQTHIGVAKGGGDGGDYPILGLNTNFL